MADQSNVPPPTPQAALAAVTEFLRRAIDAGDPVAARAMMTAGSVGVAAFDPAGLSGKQYEIGEPFPHENAVIVPVGFGDASGERASFPLVVVLEAGLPKVDVATSVEMMLGGEVHFVDPDEVEDEDNTDDAEVTPAPK